MAKETNWPALLVVGLVALLLGGLLGALAFSKTVTETKTITLEKEVEVPVEVEVEKIVELSASEQYLDVAVDEVLKYLEDEDLLFCNGKEYDADETSISKVYDNWSVAFDEEEYTVIGSLKLKFKESDLRSCRETFDFKVFYEEDEKPEVTIL